MSTVAELVAALGPAQLAIGVGSGRADVRDVSLVPADSVVDPDVGAGDLVLCVTGAADVERLPSLVRELAELRVAAVALTRDTARHPLLVAAARDADVCLLEVAPGTAWAQLVWLLIGLLDAAPRGAGAPAPATGFGELFTFADALEAVLGGPVTIEDSASRVLAHSARQEGADPARLSTIVGRRVPAELTERFRSMGVLRALQRSDEPIVVPPWGPGISPRLVIPVRAGRELLGSIWAVVDRPVAPEHAAELQRVVSLLALQLLRLRAQEDLVARLEADRLQAALTGEPPPGWSLPGEAPWRVVCLAETAAGTAPGQADRWRSVLRWSGWRTPLLGEVDGSLFALVNSGPARQAGSWSWLQDNTGTGLLAASSPVTGPPQLNGARLQAVEVMQLLRDDLLPVPSRERQLVTAEEAWAAIVVARAVRKVDEADVGGPIEQLLEHDRRTGTEYAVTLAAELAHPGDPRAAAARVHVHPNTFRYRMRKLRNVVDLDLADPQVRLAAQLQLLAAERDLRR
jgi:PucR C-terminal helix-turn-helix domain